MSSLSRSFPSLRPLLVCTLILGLAAPLLPTSAARAQSAPLRVCADPDNPPFSARSTPGFDNRIAALLARDLHRPLQLVWARERRGFLREQFEKNACDVLLGVPAGMRRIALTTPYYRSTYVFVTPAADHLQIASFDDTHLNGRRIGLQILEEDLSPPSLPLIRAGHAGQLVGFESFGKQGGDIVRAVVDHRVGVAVVWGPLASWFSRGLPLTITPVAQQVDAAGIPLAFSICAGVHTRDTALRDALNAAIARHRSEINSILASYRVPTLPLEAHS